MSGAAVREKSALAKGVARCSLLLVLGLATSGCSTIGDQMPDFLSSNAAAPVAQQVAAAPEGQQQTELQKATEYWGNEFRTKPSDLNAALSFAKNLKALGQKGEALGVLQQASLYHAADKRLASEYGRLALELDQVAVASKLLAHADDPAMPDWRVISARGTVFAKQGKYAEAIPFYERALSLADGQPSVLNNLALAHAMNGEAGKAEDLLRRAVAADANNKKTRQNLALVLGLQGKYSEATQTASAVMPPNSAAANTDIVRKIVKLQPKDSPASVTAIPATAVASAPAPVWKGTAVDNAPASGAGAWSTQVASSATAAPALPWTSDAATVTEPSSVSTRPGSN